MKYAYFTFIKEDSWLKNHIDFLSNKKRHTILENLTKDFLKILQILQKIQRITI